MKALMFRVKLLFRNDNGSLQDKCSLFHTSPRQQLGRKKMFTQLESQFWMIFIFDRDHASTVPGSRITEVVRKTFFQFSQSFKSILLSIISKIKQMPWWVLRVWQIITCFLKSGLRRETVLPGLGKKECRGASGGWLARWLPLWQSCLPKIYHSSSRNHNFSAFLYSRLSYTGSPPPTRFSK